jgi:predicted nuclease of predicted toxin-antitoxin system
MRLLLDEQLSSAIAVKLRSRGHDVVTVAEAGLAGRGDPEILAWATAERRAVVTGNIQDFRPLHIANLTAATQHFGIVLISTSHSLRRSDLGRVITALGDLLAAHTAEDALRDRERFL